MSLRVELTWKGRFGEKVKARMARALTTSCSEFFHRMEGVSSVTLIVFGPDSHRSSVGNRAVFIAPVHLVDQKIYQGGLPVYVKCDANAQLCYLNVEGMSSDELRQTVSMGSLSRHVTPKVTAPEEGGIKVVPLTQTVEPQAPPADTVLSDSQSENSGTRRVVDDSPELLRMFWETILADGIGQIEGSYLILTNEILTARAVKDFSITPTQGEKVSFYRKCVAPFGEAVLVKSNKGWKLSVPTLQEFLQGGSLSRKRPSSEPQRGAIKKEDMSKGGREPDAVLNELEVLLKRIEFANQLQSEQSALQVVHESSERNLKELDERIVSTERMLAELRGNREALKQGFKRDNARLEEIEVLLAQNKVSEETRQRLRKMGVLKGTATGEENTVVHLVAQSGKS